MPSRIDATAKTCNQNKWSNCTLPIHVYGTSCRNFARWVKKRAHWQAPSIFDANCCAKNFACLRFRFILKACDTNSQAPKARAKFVTYERIVMESALPLQPTGTYGHYTDRHELEQYMHYLWFHASSQRWHNCTITMLMRQTLNRYHYMQWGLTV